MVEGDLNLFALRFCQAEQFVCFCNCGGEWLLDQYVTAARQVARLAVGNPNPRVAGVKYAVAANQSPRNPLPPGTRGGIAFEHNFPVDGDYQINIKDLAVGPYSNALETQSTLVILIDGRIVFRQPIGGRVDLAGSPTLHFP